MNEPHRPGVPGDPAANHDAQGLPGRLAFDIEKVFADAQRLTRGRDAHARLRRIMGIQRSSAAVLRHHGREQAAVRAERTANRIELMLDDPATVRRMFWAARVIDAMPGTTMDAVLEGAMELAGADMGNVQLCDPRTTILRIAAHHGFSGDFLRHFAVVADSSSVCGRAARLKTAVVIANVDDDRAFARHQRFAMAAGFRAVQSIPIIDQDERVIGVVSTHFRQAHRPSLRDRLLMDWYVEHVAAVLRLTQAPATV